MTATGLDTEIRVVLDTSVTLPILLQREPETNPLLQLWQSHRIKPLVNDETLSELRAQLMEKSPTAKQLQAQRFVRLALRRYLPWCDHLPLQEISSAPRCRDPKDQIFVDLAIGGNARYLLTRDKDLLDMESVGNVSILPDSQFLRNHTGWRRLNRLNSCFDTRLGSPAS